MRPWIHPPAETGVEQRLQSIGAEIRVCRHPIRAAGHCRGIVLSRDPDVAGTSADAARQRPPDQGPYLVEGSGLCGLKHRERSLDLFVANLELGSRPRRKLAPRPVEKLINGHSKRGGFALAVDLTPGSVALGYFLTGVTDDPARKWGACIRAGKVLDGRALSKTLETKGLRQSPTSFVLARARCTVRGDFVNRISEACNHAEVHKTKGFCDSERRLHPRAWRG